LANINFYTEELKYQIRDIKKLRNWITQIVKEENRQSGVINFILCTDEYLLALNRKYLYHDTYTDIITFDFTEANDISGDIYISIERVRENAKNFKTTISNELYRVISHGVLHLIGYKDKSEKDARLMRKKEDYYLSLLPNFL
jgi:rRNA maturation RNase YbeY